MWSSILRRPCPLSGESLATWIVPLTLPCLLTVLLIFAVPQVATASVLTPEIATALIKRMNQPRLDEVERKKIQDTLVGSGDLAVAKLVFANLLHRYRISPLPTTINYGDPWEAVTLGGIRDEAAGRMIMGRISDNDSYSRMAAVNVLGYIRDNWAEDLLLETMSDPDNRVFGSAMVSAGRTGRQKLQEAAMSVAEEGPDERSEIAARVIADLRTPWTREVLTKALFSRKAAIAASAVSVLGRTFGSDSITLLLEALEKGNPIVRVLVLDELWRILGRDSLVHCVNSLDDPFPEVREKAVAILGAAGDDRSVENLRQMLHDPSPEVLAGALRALNNYPFLDETFQEVVLLLYHQNQHVRLAAVDYVASSETEMAVPGLIAALDDDNLNVRRAAVAALGNYPSPAAVGVLVTRISDNRLKKEVIGALQGMREYLAGNAYVLEILDREKSGEESRVGQLDSGPGIEAEVEAAVEPAVEAGLDLGSRSLQELHGLLAEKDLNLRKKAAVEIGQRRDGTSIGPLFTVLRLSGEEGSVLLEAAEALSGIDSPEVRDLIEFSARYNPPEVRTMAAVVLGHVNDPRALDLLIANLKDVHLKYGLLALARKDSPQAIGAIIKNYNSLRANEMDEVIRLAFNTSNSGAIPLLEHAAKSDPVNAKLVAYLLKKAPVGLPVLLDILRSANSAEGRRAALEGIRSAKPSLPADWETEESLIKALNDGSPEVSGLAALILGDMKSERGAVAVAKMLDEPDPFSQAERALNDKGRDLVGIQYQPNGDAYSVISIELPKGWRAPYSLRRNLALALYHIGSPVSADTMMRLLDDRDLRIRSLACLYMGKTKMARATGDLVEHLGDRTQTSETAAFALGQIGDPAAIEPIIKKWSSGDLNGLPASWALAQFTEYLKRPSYEDLLESILRTGYLENGTHVVNLRHAIRVLSLVGTGRATSLTAQAQNILAMRESQTPPRESVVPGSGSQGKRGPLERPDPPTWSSMPAREVTIELWENPVLLVGRGSIPEDDAPARRLELLVRKTGSEPSAGSQLLGSVSVQGAEVTVRLENPSGTGLFRAELFLPQKEGAYRFFLRLGERVDQYRLILDDRSIALKPVTAAFSAPGAEKFWKWPRNSFCFRCEGDRCDPALEAIRGDGRFVEFRFPPEGRQPACGIEPGEGGEAVFFLYGDALDYKELRSLLENNLSGWENPPALKPGRRTMIINYLGDQVVWPAMVSGESFPP